MVRACKHLIHRAPNTFSVSGLAFVTGSGAGAFQFFSGGVGTIRVLLSSFFSSISFVQAVLSSKRSRSC